MNGRDYGHCILGWYICYVCGFTVMLLIYVRTYLNCILGVIKYHKLLLLILLYTYVLHSDTSLLLILLTQKNKSYLIVMYGTWWYLLSITALDFALCIACTVETHVLACVTYCFLEYYYCSIHTVEQ